MNDIISSNFFCLLASGAFQEKAHVQPMSVYKWRQLFRLAAAHEVTDYVINGMSFRQDEFFLQQPLALYKTWLHEMAAERQDNDDEVTVNLLTTPDHLTNPLLNHAFQRILEDDGATEETRKMMLLLTAIVRYLMNEGFPVKQLVELGRMLREQGNLVDYVTLQTWLDKVHMTKMSCLTGALLIQLFHFSANEIPFITASLDSDLDSVVKDVFRPRTSTRGALYFSQGDDIFVHASNTGALLGHVERSLKYFKYYPSESFTNFFASFAHSLSHIEE